MKENKKELNKKEVEKISGGDDTLRERTSTISLEKIRYLATPKAYGGPNYWENRPHNKYIKTEKEETKSSNTTEIAKLPKE